MSDQKLYSCERGCITEITTLKTGVTEHILNILSVIRLLTRECIKYLSSTCVNMWDGA